MGLRVDSWGLKEGWPSFGEMRRACWDLGSRLVGNLFAIGLALLQGNMHSGREADLDCFHNLDGPKVLVGGIEDLSQGWLRSAAGRWTRPEWEFLDL